MDESKNRSSLGRMGTILGMTAVIAIVTAVASHAIQYFALGEAKPVMTGGAVVVITAVFASRWWRKSG